MHYPEHGQTIQFLHVPTGSYCVPGAFYRVDRRKGINGDFRFVNIATGYSTFDRPSAVRRAEWRVLTLRDQLAASIEEAAA